MSDDEEPTASEIPSQSADMSLFATQVDPSLAVAADENEDSSNDESEMNDDVKKRKRKRKRKEKDRSEMIDDEAEVDNDDEVENQSNNDNDDDDDDDDDMDDVKDIKKDNDDDDDDDDDDDNDDDDDDDNDDDGDDDNDDDENSTSPQRSRNDYALDRDDIELAEENLGLAQPKKKAPKRKRLRKKNLDADDLAQEVGARLFGEDDLSADSDNDAAAVARVSDDEIDFSGDSDSDDLARFVVNRVDEHGNAIDEPRRRRKKKRRAGGMAALMGGRGTAQQLMEAQRIFGNAQDLAAYMNVGKEVDMDDDNADDAAALVEGATADTSLAQLAKKYEPAVLRAEHLTPRDAALRRSARPERFVERFEVVKIGSKEDRADVSPDSLITVRATPNEAELKEEAAWIWRPDGRAQRLHRRATRHQRSSDYDDNVRRAIAAVLQLLLVQHYEVPYIAHYLKEQWLTDLSEEFLWTIAAEDEKYVRLVRQRERLQEKVMEVSTYAQEILERNLAADDSDDEKDDALAPDVDPEVLELRRKAAKARRQELKQMTQVEFMPLSRAAELLQSEYAPRNATSTHELDDIARYCERIQCRRETLNDMAEKAAAEAMAAVVGGEASHMPQQSVLRRGLPGMNLNQYRRAMRLKLTGLASCIGLSARQFGENLSKSMLEHVPVDLDVDPSEKAAEYIDNQQIYIAEDALAGARALLAEEIASEPAVRVQLRLKYRNHLRLSTTPTSLGDSEIDPFHKYASIKCIKQKAVLEYLQSRSSQFLLIQQAVREGYITMDLNTPNDYLWTDVLQLYQSEKFTGIANAWNRQRELVLESAIRDRLFNQLQQELIDEMASCARQAVLDEIRDVAFSKFDAGPYRRRLHEDNCPQDQTCACPPLYETEREYNDPDRTVMGVVCGTDDVPTMCVVLDRDGEYVDSLKLSHFYKLRTTRTDAVDAHGESVYEVVDTDRHKARLKEGESKQLEEFILTHEPNVIGVGAMPGDKEAYSLIDDIVAIASDTTRNEMWHQTRKKLVPEVHFVDGASARAYAASPESQKQFPDRHLLFRQAVAVGRRLLDPLVEYAQLCTDVENPPIAHLNWHNLQGEISKSALIGALKQQLMVAVARVGVDIHQAVYHQHYAPLLQFVAGLGPRKAAALLNAIRRLPGGRLTSRMAVTLGRDGRAYDGGNDDGTSLQAVCAVIGGDVVWRNCAGFLRLSDRHAPNMRLGVTDPLDTTRVHPDDYNLARKMASDLYDEDDDDSEPLDDGDLLGACRKLIKHPEKLADLDLSAFAEELSKRHIFKRNVLDDVRSEFRRPFGDPRRHYAYPTALEVFFMIIGEEPESLLRGTLVQMTVTTVRQFFVRGFLDNGAGALIEARDLSDKAIEDCRRIVKPRQVIEARVLSVDGQAMPPIVRLTTSSNSLSVRGELVQGRIHELKMLEPMLDTGEAFQQRFVQQRIDERRTKEEREEADEEAMIGLNRLIVHPRFKNISHKRMEIEMADKPFGHVLFRPSSKSMDKISMAWRFWGNKPDGSPIIANITIEEEEKGEQRLALGKKLLLMVKKTVDETRMTAAQRAAARQELEFSDLNEIYERYVRPCNKYCKNVVEHAKFSSLSMSETEKILKEEKEANLNGIPYRLLCSVDYPGRFVLAYVPKPNKKVKKEVVSVTPDGLRLRNERGLQSAAHVIHWFKKNWHKPIPRPARRSAPVQQQAPPQQQMSSSSSYSGYQRPSGGYVGYDNRGGYR